MFIILWLKNLSLRDKLNESNKLNEVEARMELL